MSRRTLGDLDGPDADADFWRWARARGVVAVRCEARDVAEGWRGIVATEDIERDAVVLRVPGDILMSARSMERDEQLRDALRTHGETRSMTPADKLAVHLLLEASRGRGSRWHEYISRLPRAYNLLCCWTRRERAMLQDPAAIAVARRARDATRQSWERARDVLAALGLTLANRWGSIDAWRWAHCTVSSRTVYVPYDAAGALCPVGDLFNYAPPPPPHRHAIVGTPLEGGDEGGEHDDDEGEDEGKKDEGGREGKRWTTSGDGAWEEASREYVFRARRPYVAGEQIMLCYGRHTNLGLLEHYGFLLDEKESETGGAEPGNPHDAAAFALGFDLDDTDDATAVTTSVSTTTTTTTTVVEASAVDGSLEWEATRGLRLWAAR